MYTYTEEFSKYFISAERCTFRDRVRDELALYDELVSFPVNKIYKNKMKELITFY